MSTGILDDLMRFIKFLSKAVLSEFSFWLCVAMHNHQVKTLPQDRIQCPVRASRWAVSLAVCNWSQLLCQLNDSLDRSKSYHQLFTQPFLMIFFLDCFTMENSFETVVYKIPESRKE